MALVFSKYFYLASINSYYTFYLIDKFHCSVQSAQLHLFVFLAAVAVGGMHRRSARRPDRPQIRDLGVDPRRAAVHAAAAVCEPVLDRVLTVIIGLILASAFPAILVYAQELMPGKVGMVAGLFFGFAFGMGGVGAAVLGRLADHVGIAFVYQVCAFLPLIGLLAGFLPDVHKYRPQHAR